MPRGDTVARIDGPDRRGWAFASETLAYYPVMRHGPASANTIHRIDLRTGSRARIVTDGRPGMQLLSEPNPQFTALALTTDKRKLLVARALRSGPRVWVGRYDAASGALETERSWPITAATAANVRLAVAGDVFVMVATEDVRGEIVQEMRFLDASLRELGSLAEADLPPGERCAAPQPTFEGERWATVCAGPESRYASVLILDGAYHVTSRVSVDLNAREHVTAWAARGGSIGILTDHARHIQVGRDGGIESSWLGEPDGRTVIRIAREIAPGIVVAQLIRIGDAAPVGDIAIFDLSTLRVIRSAAWLDSALDFVGTVDRLYVLLTGVDGRGARLQRLDRETLAPVGIAATLPQRDDVMVHGLITLAPAR